MSISGITSSDITHLINSAANTSAGKSTAATDTTTSATTGAAGSSTTAATKSKTSAFDTDTFMKLLLAELKHQDPLEPMKNSEMLGQMAQLNSLQQLTNISTNIGMMKDYMEALLGISS